MPIKTERASILIIAIWFGRVPEWFHLWLTSCRWNTDINWLIVGQNNAAQHSIPVNVHLVEMSMDEIAQKIQNSVHTPVNFASPYKACDLRPAFWSLIDLVPGQWDFWGHCDLDVIFGDIRKFATPEVLHGHDRVFGLGHLSLYRNCPEANTFFQKPNPHMDFREVFNSHLSYGFDEHWGVNTTWRIHGGHFYENEALVLDIDPDSTWLRRISTNRIALNPFHQAFAYTEGKILRYAIGRRRVRVAEYMYIHFQKREMPTFLDDTSTSAWISPRGLLPMQSEPIDRATIDCVNPPGHRLTLARLRGPIRRLLMLTKRRVLTSFRIGTYVSPQRPSQGGTS